MAVVKTGFVSEARVTSVWGLRDERSGGVEAETDESRAAMYWLDATHSDWRAMRVSI